jgi:hypothetical protein
MILKLSEREEMEPISPIKLNQMSVFLGPQAFTQSPPKRDPELMPIIEAVDRTVI